MLKGVNKHFMNYAYYLIMGNIIDFCCSKGILPTIKFNFVCCGSKIVDECEDINIDDQDHDHD